jgi:RNA polymerase sigma factor (sigma-70 family)
MSDNERVGMDAAAAGRAGADHDAARARDARLVDSAVAGDQQAFGRLYDLWFDRVFGLVRRIVHDQEVAAEVAQDAFLSAWRSLATLERPEAFGGWLLRIARNAALNRGARERRSQPVDDRGLAVIESVGASPSSAPAGFAVEDRLGSLDDPAKVAEDGEIVALVREATAALGERDAEVLELQLTHGLSPAEIGEVIGMNRNAANQLCHRIRGRFATALGARVLWRGRRPDCDALSELLASAGIERFDADAVKLADRHAEGCERCSERRQLRLQPATLFASVPVVVAPVVLKQQAAAALEAAGVPMDGSAFSPSAAADGAHPDRGADGRDTPSGPAAASHRLRSVAARSLVAAVLVVVVVAVLAARVHEGTVDDELTVADSDPATTASAPSEPSLDLEVSPGSDDEGAAAEGDTPTEVPVGTSSEPASPPGTAPPPGAVPPAGTPPPPSAPAPLIRFDLRPTTAGTAYQPGSASAPLLQWAVSGARSVRVEGVADGNAGVVLSNASEGSASVCPGVLVGGSAIPRCASSPGVYDYVIVVEGDDGQVHTRHATLIIVAT